MTSRLDHQLAAYVADLDIHAHERQEHAGVLHSLLSEQPATPRPRLTQNVYTAFDGDHFAHVPAIRRHALAHNKMPLNPESVVGYKDSVDAYGTKFGVLKADLAVLAKCDALWIYTDVVTHVSDLSHLSEGVLLELLWFVDRHNPHTHTPTDSSRHETSPRAPRPGRNRASQPAQRTETTRPPSANLTADIRIVSLRDTILGNTATPRRIALGWDELIAQLKPSQLDLLDRLDDMRRWGLPEVALALIDPLDAKYADWVRAWGHHQSVVTIVPTLVIEVADAPLALVIHAWRKLVTTCDLVWTFPPVDPGRPPSRWVDDMMALVHSRKLQCDERSWAEVGAPKVVFGDSWPLSRSERAQVPDTEHA